MDTLSDNPSLKPRLGELITQAYRTARDHAAYETGLPLSSFPKDCPFDWAAIIDPGFTGGAFED